MDGQDDDLSTLSLPDLENLESASQVQRPGTTDEPNLHAPWRCSACDSQHLARDAAGFWYCQDCGCTLYYHTDHPTLRRANHGRGTWHYVPAGPHDFGGGDGLDWSQCRSSSADSRPNFRCYSGRAAPTRPPTEATTERRTSS